MSQSLKDEMTITVWVYQWNKVIVIQPNKVTTIEQVKQSILPWSKKDKRNNIFTIIIMKEEVILMKKALRCESHTHGLLDVVSSYKFHDKFLDKFHVKFAASFKMPFPKTLDVF